MNLFLWFFSTLCYSQLYVYVASPKEAPGERNQLLSLAHSLAETEKDVIIKEFLIQPVSVLKKKIAKELQSSSKGRFVLMTSGIEGAKLLACWNRGSGSLKKVHLSHQDLPEYEKMIPFTDLCVLPKHVWSSRFDELKKSSKCRWFETTGVLHGLVASTLKQHFEKNRKLIPEGSSYVVAILGGDARDSSGKVRLFSEEDAQALARLAVDKALLTKAVVIGVNGPRTGRYSRGKKNLLDKKAHRKGVRDPITQTFWSKVEEKLPKEKRILFDFQYGKPGFYETILGALLEKGGDIYVPGDSISMVSETADLFPGKVFAYETFSMNSSHYAHIQTQKKTGRIFWIPRGSWEEKSLIMTPESKTSQVKILAEEIRHLWD